MWVADALFLCGSWVSCYYYFLNFTVIFNSVLCIIIINGNLYSKLSSAKSLKCARRTSSVQTKTSLTVVWMFREWDHCISSILEVSSMLVVLHSQMHVQLWLLDYSEVRRVKCGPMTADDDVLQTPKSNGLAFSSSKSKNIAVLSDQDCCRTTTTILPLFIVPKPLAATYRRVNMKALARYQLILLGEQRHIGVSNLPKVVARQCSGRESNPRPLDHESDTLTTTPPTHPHVRVSVNASVAVMICRPAL